MGAIIDNRQKIWKMYAKEWHTKSQYDVVKWELFKNGQGQNKHMKYNKIFL